MHQLNVMPRLCKSSWCFIFCISLGLGVPNLHRQANVPWLPLQLGCLENVIGLASQRRRGPIGLAIGYLMQAATNADANFSKSRRLCPIGLAIGYQLQAGGEMVW